METQLLSQIFLTNIHIELGKTKTYVPGLQEPDDNGHR